MSELKPCAHCGGEAEVFYVEASGTWDAQCQMCGALPYVSKTKQEAIDSWNTRYVETCVCDGTIQWQWTGPTTYFEHELSCGHVITSTEKEPPNFCEECGRRVER